MEEILYSPKWLNSNKAETYLTYNVGIAECSFWATPSLAGQQFISYFQKILCKEKNEIIIRLYKITTIQLLSDIIATQIGKGPITIFYIQCKHSYIIAMCKLLSSQFMNFLQLFAIFSLRVNINSQDFRTMWALLSS